MGKEPLVSIVVSTIRPYLWKTLSLSAASAAKFPIEVIFVGNGSNKDVPEWYDINPPGGARFIHSNESPCKAWNIGFKSAQGKYVMWAPDDTLFLPGSINAMIECCESSPNPEKTIVAPQYIELLPRWESTEDGISYTGWKEFVQFQAIVNPCVPDYFSREINFAPLGFLYRDFMEKLGYFREFYWGGICENDLCVRAFCSGGNIVVGTDATKVVLNQIVSEKGHRIFSKKRDICEKLFYEVWKDGYEEGMNRSTAWGIQKRKEIAHEFRIKRIQKKIRKLKLFFGFQ